MNLDSSVVKLIILFIPGVIGITLLDLFFVPKIKWSFQERLFFSVVLGLGTYIPNFDTLKNLINSANVLGDEITLTFILKASFISLLLIGFILILNRISHSISTYLDNISAIYNIKGFLQKIFGGNIVEEQSTLLNFITKRNDLKNYLTDYVIIRTKENNSYVGILKAYNFKGDNIEIFLTDAEWYKDGNNEIYLSFKSILLTFKTTDITLEFKE